MAKRRDSLIKHALRLAFLVFALVICLIIAAIFFLPSILERLVEYSLSKGKIENVEVEIDSVGPFSLQLDHFNANWDGIDVEVRSAEANYSPSSLIRERSIESLSIGGVRAEVDLATLQMPEGDEEPPILLPSILEEAPVHNILQQNGRLELKFGDVTKEIAFEGMFERDSGGKVLAVIHAQPLIDGTPDRQDSIFLSLSGDDGEGTASANFLLGNPLDWLDILGPFFDAPDLEVMAPAIGLVSGEITALVVQRRMKEWDASTHLKQISTQSGAPDIPGLDLEDLFLKASGQSVASDSDAPTPLNIDLRLGVGSLASVPFSDGIFILDAQIPGSVAIHQATLNLAGGKFGIAPVTVAFDNESIHLPEPLLLTLEDLDLSLFPLNLVQQGFAGEGVINLALLLEQDESSRLPHKLAVDSSLLSPRLELASESLDASAILADIDLRLSGSDSLTIDTASPLHIQEVRFRSYTLSGNTRLAFSGTVLNPAVALKGVPLNLDFRTELTLRDALISGRVECYGVSGTFGGAFSNAEYQLQAESVTAEKITIGDISFENARSAVEIVNGEIATFDLGATLLGGEVSVEDVEGSLTNVSFTIRLRGVNSAKLSELVPRFEGRVAGPLDGYLRLRYDGAIHIIAGQLALRDGESGRFAYPDASELFGDEQDQMVMRRLQTSLEDLILERFIIRLDPTDPDQPPIRILIAGAGAKRGSIPVEIDLKLQGDITYVLELILGNKFTITFN